MNRTIDRETQEQDRWTFRRVFPAAMSEEKELFLSSVRNELRYRVPSCGLLREFIEIPHTSDYAPRYPEKLRGPSGSIVALSNEDWISFPHASHSLQFTGELILVKVLQDRKSETLGDAVAATQRLHHRDAFVRNADRLDRNGNRNSAMDLIHDQVDEMMRSGEFDLLNQILERSKAESLTTDVLLCLLTASLPAKSRLPSRRAFFQATEKSLKERGDYEDGLLTGLE